MRTYVEYKETTTTTTKKKIDKKLFQLLSTSSGRPTHKNTHVQKITHNTDRNV